MDGKSNIALYRARRRIWDASLLSLSWLLHELFDWGEQLHVDFKCIKWPLKQSIQPKFYGQLIIIRSSFPHCLGVCLLGHVSIAYIRVYVWQNITIGTGHISCVHCPVWIHVREHNKGNDWATPGGLFMNRKLSCFYFGQVIRPDYVDSHSPLLLRNILLIRSSSS